jgi:long-chain-acyl-CoA dehydrogenase
VRRFVAEEIEPYYDTWERQGAVDRALWTKAGRLGLLGLSVPEEFGGHSAPDFGFNAVVIEELMFAGAAGVGFPIHSDIAVPYLIRLGTDLQKARWLPGVVDGSLIVAIAMTEPGAGSDLAGIQTTARRRSDGFVINGQKTFITNGLLNDLVIVVAREPGTSRHDGISLFVVESGTPGYRKGPKLEKIGQHAQDTAELFFDDVWVPEGNLLGGEGAGFRHLMENLPQERLVIALGAVAAAEAALETSLTYAKNRLAFERPLAANQAVRFTLADMRTEVEVARAFVDACLEAFIADALDPAEAAMAKWWSTETLKRVVDRGVQLHGGYGYMAESPIARAYVDARAQTIYGGTTEIMKEIVARWMGL